VWRRWYVSLKRKEPDRRQAASGRGRTTARDRQRGARLCVGSQSAVCGAATYRCSLHAARTHQATVVRAWAVGTRRRRRAPDAEQLGEGQRRESLGKRYYTRPSTYYRLMIDVVLTVLRCIDH
jgi:hypothetical protein